jgi:hypothetical protein
MAFGCIIIAPELILGDLKTDLRSGAVVIQAVHASAAGPCEVALSVIVVEPNLPFRNVAVDNNMSGLRVIID